MTQSSLNNTSHRRRSQPPHVAPPVQARAARRPRRQVPVSTAQPQASPGAWMLAAASSVSHNPEPIPFDTSLAAPRTGPEVAPEPPVSQPDGAMVSARRVSTHQGSADQGASIIGQWSGLLVMCVVGIETKCSPLQIGNATTGFRTLIRALSANLGAPDTCRSAPTWGVRPGLPPRRQRQQQGRASGRLPVGCSLCSQNLGRQPPTRASAQPRRKGMKGPHGPTLTPQRDPASAARTSA